MLTIFDIEEIPTFTNDAVAITLQKMEELKQRVSEVFLDYCKIFDIHSAYGVEHFSFGSDGKISTSNKILRVALSTVVKITTWMCDTFTWTTKNESL